MTCRTTEGLEEYRVALFAPGGHGVLAIREIDSILLPRVYIPKFARTAQQITSALLNLFHVDTIVVDFLSEASTRTPCAVAEICVHLGDLSRTGLTLIDPSMIPECELSHEERIALLAIAQGTHASSRPLSSIGWLAEAKHWIGRNACASRSDFTGRITQLNGGGSFCLLRLEMKSGPALWLKAVGKPNLHEYDITMYLAGVEPGYLPPIRCSRSDWHAWVMEEVGTDLERTADFENCARAIRALAGLQTSMLGRVERLISSKCADHRAGALLVHLDHVFSFIVEAMAMQAGGHTPPLPPDRVMELKKVMRLALTTIDEMSFPPSISHNDMGLSNILCDEERCVFIDWCEAYVGNPFNAYELFRVILNRHQPSSAAWADELRAIYLATWMDLLGEARTKALMTLTPVLTIYSCLYSRGFEWIEAHRSSPSFQRRTRILARHLERASRDPEFLRQVHR